MTLNSDWTQHGETSPSPWTEQRAEMPSPCWKRVPAAEGTGSAQMCGDYDCDEVWERNCDTLWDYSGMTSADEDESLELVTSELHPSIKTLPSRQRSCRPPLPKRHPLRRPETRPETSLLSALGRRQRRLLEELSSLGRYDRSVTARADIQAYQVTGGGGTTLGRPEGAGQVTGRSGQIPAGRLSLSADLLEPATPLPPFGRRPTTGRAEAVLEGTRDGGGEVRPVEGHPSPEVAIPSDAAVVRPTPVLSQPVTDKNNPEMSIFDSPTNVTIQKNSSGVSEASLQTTTTEPGPGTASADLTRLAPGLPWSSLQSARLLPTAAVAAAGFSVWEMVDADLAEEEAERDSERETWREEKAEDAAREERWCPPEFQERRYNHQDDLTRLGLVNGSQYSPQYSHDHEYARHRRHESAPEHNDGNGSGNDSGEDRGNDSGNDSEDVDENGGGNCPAREDSSRCTGAELTGSISAESERCDADLLDPAPESVSDTESELTADMVGAAPWADVWRDWTGRDVNWLVSGPAEWSPSDSGRLSSLRVDSPGDVSDPLLSDSARLGREPVRTRSACDPQWSSARDFQLEEAEKGACARDRSVNQTEACLSDASLSDASLSVASLSDEVMAKSLVRCMCELTACLFYPQPRGPAELVGVSLQALGDAIPFLDCTPIAVIGRLD